ncbi:MAG: hypothetical protein HQ567_14290 [Candidatus Nealsonbacteria bacterium]|nr:hypothetical protein [Candidatus Nealsonbacteria bacterium]
MSARKKTRQTRGEGTRRVGAAAAIKRAMAKLDDEAIRTVKPARIREMMQKSKEKVSPSASQISNMLREERKDRQEESAKAAITFEEYNRRLKVVSEFVGGEKSIDSACDVVKKIQRLYCVCEGWDGLDRMLQAIKPVCKAGK